MRRENINLFFAILGIGAIIIVATVLMKPSKTPEITNEAPNTTAQNTTVPTQAASDSMNPSYGELTEDQIKIADIAIGKLLNSSEGITPPMITVTSFEAQEFSDAALGCPQPDMMYAQVITPGYKVVLEAQGKEYDYRLTDAENIILCEL